eukprot:2676731-Pyramimonas_sp.AAC.1
MAVSRSRWSRCDGVLVLPEVGAIGGRCQRGHPRWHIPRHRLMGAARGALRKEGGGHSPP